MDAFITDMAAQEPDRPVLDHDTVRRHFLDLILAHPADRAMLVPFSPPPPAPPHLSSISSPLHF